MLTPEQFNEIAGEASKIYSKLELEIIEEIAERIANVGYANTVVKNDTMIAQEMGLLYQDIVNLAAEYNNESYEKIQSIFNEAGIKTLKFDDRIYKEAGLNPVPIKQSKTMLQLLLATAEKTSNNLSNLTMTTANTSQTEFYNAMNKAYMEVSTGVKSYSQSIMDAVENIASKGAIVEYPSGYKTSIENATRMNVVTGVSQTCGKLQLMRAKELEWDLMELTAHSGARPTHAAWQGRIVSLSGQDGYLSLNDIGYGTATGFKGISCYHDWRPYYEGSSRTYTNNELEKMANETVIYNGQKIKRYDAQQMQRRMERQIRQNKKDIAGIKGLLTSNNKDLDVDSTKSKLQQLQNRYNVHNNTLNDFLEQTKFRKDNSRLFVVNNKILPKETKNDNIIPEYKKNLIKEQYRRYSQKELKQLAKETNNIVNKYINNESKWSGKLTILEQGIKEKGIVINYAKLWNCNILLHPETAPSMIIHEQLHAHSISYYTKKIYRENSRIEEATIQLMTKEICKKEKINYIASQYDEWVKKLEEINKIVGIKSTNLEFVQELISISPEKRIEFIEEKAINLTIDKWSRLGDLLDELRN